MSLINNKLRKSAKGQECQVRLPEICNWDPETTVLAHVGKGSGMGQKCDDIHATFACSACHAEMDRVTRILEKDFVDQCAYEGMVRTQTYWLSQDLIKVD
ncbi:DUF1364 domain-containing protein [Pseudoalteromonas sp. R3]|uniref:DUF1364 domain-containing protein n=1 Tax=Pseudoalteromonas sp. R3 TaxID=1709477 RepID=UPI0006B498F7|nr:DUF1364 domain-containing protein [Pseudoalteromonas sp. R3]AZZ98772.1 DUF1364 domain-containing protein [Pseudoalteromonas sp. R3]